MTDKAKKFDKDKVDYTHLPKSYLEAASRAFMFGEKKYGRHNWKQGFIWSRLMASLMRHTWSWWEGEELDPESQLNHLDHACACLAMIREHVEKQLGEDDRYESIK